MKKGDEAKLEQILELAPQVEAPVEKGQTIGTVVVKLEGKEIGRYPIEAASDVPEMTFTLAFSRLIKGLGSF